MGAGLFGCEPIQGVFHVLTGANGTGKSRYLGELARAWVGLKQYDRIICLSGTLYEKFPPPREFKERHCDYLYFGNRVNYNLVSEIAPFRVLVPIILGAGCNPVSGTLAGEALKGIGFEPSLKMRFRMGRNSKDSISRAAKQLDLRLNLDGGLCQSDDTEQRLAMLRNKEIHLSDLEIVKDGARLSLWALSSGERLYILSMLVLSFCTIDRTLILFDEPENSLHPQWQTKLIKDMTRILNGAERLCTVVIATHSPLVVSSVPSRGSLIRDLPSSGGWIESEHYGRNADSILVEQFGINSPRSLSVALIIQNCLSELLNLHDNPERFVEAVSELRSANVDFHEDDPLYDTVQQIFKIAEGLQ